MPQVSSCPGCGRTTSTYFQELARDIQTYLRDQMPVWRETHPGVEDLRVAVMGCVVNGPGESKHADIGISLPGTFEEPVAPVYIDGALDRTLRGDHIADEFKAILDAYVERRFPGPAAPRRIGAGATAWLRAGRGAAKSGRARRIDPAVPARWTRRARRPGRQAGHMAKYMTSATWPIIRRTRTISLMPLSTPRGEDAHPDEDQPNRDEQ